MESRNAKKAREQAEQVAWRLKSQLDNATLRLRHLEKDLQNATEARNRAEAKAQSYAAQRDAWIAALGVQVMVEPT